MTPEQLEQFTEMQTKLQALEEVFKTVLEDKPERIGQIIVQSRSDSAPSTGGSIRVVTTEGEVDLLIA